MDASPFEASPSSVDNWLLSLDEIDGAHLPLVGGKAYRLAVLKRNGLNVPPGLVLTAHFFKTQLDHMRVAPVWMGSPDVTVSADALTWLADEIKLRPLARPLAAALSARLDSLFDVAAGFAVRSSVIDEDHSDRTFAGIHLTELRVPRAALPIAISRCWASAFSEAALDYRQVHGMSLQAIQVAVLIQPMLSPEFAGVGFSFNPLTGSRDELVLEAAPGLGPSLVFGEGQPHFFRVANQPPTWPLLEEKPGTTPVLLPAGQRAELAQRIRQIEAMMGQPQDVEWASQRGEIFILQARPAKVPEPAPQLADVVWGLAAVEADNPLAHPSPFFGGLLAQAQPKLKQMLAELGFDVTHSGPVERVIFGRVYGNLTLLRRLAAQLGLNSERLLHTMGYPAEPAPGRIDWRAVWRARRLYRRLAQRSRAVGPLPGIASDDPLPALRRHAARITEIAQTSLALELAIATATGFIAIFGNAGGWLGRLAGTPASLLAARRQLTALRTESTAACRRWVLDVGEHWTRTGWLLGAEDILWLTPAEIERTLVGGEATAVALKATVEARKHTDRWNSGADCPTKIREAELFAAQPGQSTDGGALPDVVVGLPVSPGQVRGPVAVVVRPEVPPNLSPHSILVLPSTGPEWLPLLHRAAGLIVETGGLLSHGSIIAREYGLPAVANIPNATRRFHNGDNVLIDGSTGVVQLLEPAAK